MELRLLKHAEIDQEKWDNAILNSDFPCVFAGSNYLNAVCPAWNALVYDDYKAIMPLTENKKYGIRYLYQPHFTPQLGVFMAKRDVAIEELFIAKVSELYRYIDIECHHRHQSHCFNNTKTKVTYVLEPASAEHLNQNSKRNIKKTTGSGITVKILNRDQALHWSGKILHPFLKHTLGLKPSAVKQFYTLEEHLQKNGLLYTFAAMHSDEIPVALAHFVCNGKHAVYLKGAQTDKHASSGSMHLVMYEALKYFKNTCQWFDFGGGQIASIAQFYKGFGAVPQTYFSLKENQLPYPLKWFR
ncbi:MAG: hypothetical protein QM534_02175 [Sediminibacterium sp.]|nr:hypothetical protein [Sediminibacterium sp.]